MNAERKNDRNRTEAKPEQSGWRKALRERFGHFAQVAAHASGHPMAFVAATLMIVVWAFTGPIFGFSDTWQLVINTGTTIVTFLMVFLIQNSQNRDGAAIQLKLDELIRAVSKARNEFVDLENVSEEELEKIRERFARVAEKAKA
ncbi:MAG TPA: low affinity iron permease family protein [Planctomycetia bacterium]|nr:low affinity iron permease family protein [Planctomycetia bacterium]